MALAVLDGQMVVPTSYVRPFPLYDHLATQLNAKINQGNFSINEEYLENLHKVLNSLNEDQAKQVTVLLIHHYFLSCPDQQPFVPNNLKHSGRSGPSSLPFGIRPGPGGKGFSFELDQLTRPLQALLGIFCGL
jgi:hypothetical protein